MIHSRARCLRLLLSFPLQLIDHRRALMGVVVSVDPMEPTEKPLAPPPPLWRMWLSWPRPFAVFVSSFVPIAIPILVLVGGRRYIVNLTGCLLRRCDNPLRKILYYRLNQSTLVIKR
jgi:hypothetical protein